MIRKYHTCPLRRLAITTFLILTFFYFIASIVHHFTWYRKPRRHPTAFPPVPDYKGNHIGRLPPPPERAFRKINHESLDIDNGRYVFVKELGQGYEGLTRVYRDTWNDDRLVVMKTIFGGTRVNPLPEHLRSTFNPHQHSCDGWKMRCWLQEFVERLVEGVAFRLAGGKWMYRWAGESTGRSGGRRTISTWPVEIPATLWYTRDFLRGGKDGVCEAEYVQAVDYFYLTNLPKRNWHLVTPLYYLGTADNLAVRIRALGWSTDQVHLAYRNRFLELLDALGKMHEDGYCHDDLKGDNIFLLSCKHDCSISDGGNITEEVDAHMGLDGKWLISDLGNLRELGNVWHTIRGDIIRPRAVPNPTKDCRVQDVERAVKSYLSFLRDSTGDKDGGGRREFDVQFFQGRRGWSWIYWAWMAGVGEDVEKTFKGGAAVVEGLKRVFEMEKESEKSIQDGDEEKKRRNERKQDVLTNNIKMRWRSRIGIAPVWMGVDEVVRYSRSWSTTELLPIPLRPFHGNGNGREKDHRQHADVPQPLVMGMNEQELDRLKNAVNMELDCIGHAPHEKLSHAKGIL